MRETFEEVYNFMKLNHQVSEWAKKTTLKERVGELQKELDELKEEVDKEDFNNFREELGDVFWDLMGVMVLAEDKGLISMKGLMHEMLEKFKKRKPFVLEGRKVTLNEELDIWKKAKEEEGK